MPIRKNRNHSFKDARMRSFSLQTKINILFFTPMTIFFLLSSLALHLAGTPGLLALNVLAYVVVMSFSVIFLESFSDKLLRNLKQIALGIDTVNYSATLLKAETDKSSREAVSLDEIKDSMFLLYQKAEQLSGIYQDMKQLLLKTLQKTESKECLQFAKELGGICTKMGPLTSEVRETLSTSLCQASSLEENVNGLNNQFFISDCILKNTERINMLIQEHQLLEVKKPRKKVSEGPFEAGSLRKAIRLAEKRAA